jgi:hypothetical protein
LPVSAIRCRWWTFDPSEILQPKWWEEGRPEGHRRPDHLQTMVWPSGTQLLGSGWPLCEDTAREAALDILGLQPFLKLMHPESIGLGFAGPFAGALLAGCDELPTPEDADPDGGVGVGAFAVSASLPSNSVPRSVTARHQAPRR